MAKTIAQGAEAKIILSNNSIIKDRIIESYRLKELDERIRKSRTKSEVKLLEKASKIIPIPKLILNKEDNYKIKMEFLKGKKLSEHLDSLKNKFEVAKIMGQDIAKLHDNNIIHGDLTTSNMILAEKFKKETPNFKKELSKLKKLNLPQGEYAIFGSGPLAAQGIRDSRDLDVIVKKNLWDKLAKKYPIIKRYKDFIKIGNIEIYKDWQPWFKDVEELIDSSETLNSIKVVKLKYVLNWKKKFNREKDREDIKLIEEYQSSDKKRMFFIDFGLGFISNKLEDKAVDLHLLKQALEAKHYKHWQELWNSVEQGYKSSKDSKAVLERLKAVEKRGRYKEKY